MPYLELHSYLQSKWSVALLDYNRLYKLRYLSEQAITVCTCMHRRYRLTAKQHKATIQNTQYRDKSYLNRFSYNTHLNRWMLLKQQRVRFNIVMFAARRIINTKSSITITDHRCRQSRIAAQATIKILQLLLNSIFVCNKFTEITTRVNQAV